MSTKTTFKRIALVAVAALGFGVLSVVPSQAAVSLVTVSAATAGTAGAVGAKSDSTTASTFSVSALFDGGLADTVTVSFVQNGDFPATAVVTPLLTYLETTTASATQVDTTTVHSATNGLVTRWTTAESVAMNSGIYSISRTNEGYAGAKFGIYLDSTTSTTRPAGAYNFTIIVKAYSNGGAAVTTTYPATITVAAAAAPVVNTPASASAKAILEAGNPATVTSITDSVTSGSFTVATTPIGKILVSNFNTAGSTAPDTITAVMTGPGYIYDGTNNGRRLVVYGTSATFSIFADGTSGEGVITITTAAGASFVKKATFFDTKPVKATATVAKAYIQAGTASVADVFAIVVTDTLGNAIKDTGAVVTAAATDTTTTVG